VKVSFGVPDYALRHLRLGQEFTIRLQDDAKGYQGRVTSISPNADERDRVFTVEVTVSNHKDSLKPGMIASISLSGVPQPAAASVPLSAIVPYPSQPGRFAGDGGARTCRQMDSKSARSAVGVTHESSVAVVGVQPGEKVIAVGCPTPDRRRTHRSHSLGK